MNKLTKHIKKITIDDIRTFIYKERMNENITGSLQAQLMGFQSVTQLGQILYPKSHKDVVLIRVINYILKKIGGVYYEETNQNPANH